MKINISRHSLSLYSYQQNSNIPDPKYFSV